MTHAQEDSFNSALDCIYQSFIKRKAFAEGKLDSEVRHPEIILGIAHKLDLMPHPKRVIRITGSKGKGTTTRIIAKLLETEGLGKIGTFLSPEEIDHNDRIRINGKAASKEQFTALLCKLKPVLEETEKTLKNNHYLSPMGIFLLLALMHFKEKKVDYYVLEGGRGAQYDEVGNIPAKVAVITSIFNEHASYLGRTIENIAANKLYAGKQSDYLVCPPMVAQWNEKLSIISKENIIIVPKASPIEAMPFWFSDDIMLAQTATEKFIGKKLSSLPDVSNCSSSFGRFKNNDVTYYYDACIHATSIDDVFLKKLISFHKKILFLVSLPDDKDAAGIFEKLNTLKADYKEITLTGIRGYLHYERAKKHKNNNIEINYTDSNSLKTVTNELMKSNDIKALYFLGTQTYIRLVKLALT